ncbi:MAG TPA: YdjY domain-containing protein [Pirellulales bacterium]
MLIHVKSIALVIGLFVGISLAVAGLDADEPPAGASNGAGDKNIVYMTKDRDVWLDKQKKEVVLKGKVALREGNLEMLACPEQTKEYESIIALSAHKMENVHAALLAAGAKPGHPAKFDTTFHPPTGTPIEVTIRWTDKDGKNHEARGQDWVRNLKTHKPLEYSWVFAGSRFIEDPETHEKHYAANDGDFVSVVNFADSAIDLSFESPKDWSEHVFEPFTEHIPPKGTDVEVVLTPKLKSNENK